VGVPAVLFHLVPDPVRFPQGLAPLYLIGRLIAALLGAATVLVLYLALRRESTSLAWGSVMLLTICPLHVINSQYATVDVPATFLLVLAFLFALRGAEGPTLRHAMMTGLFVGLAAATKYNAGLFLLPALLAPVLSSVEQERACSERSRRVSCPGPWKGKRGGLSWWLGVPAGAAVGFLICNPWVGTQEFREGFLFEWRHAQAGGTFAFVGTGNGWSYHLLHGLPVALGYPFLAAFILGLALAIRSKSPAVRFSLLWCLFYFAVIGFGRERFVRYLVPMMPFVSILAALALGRTAEFLARRRWALEIVVTEIGWALLMTLYYLFLTLGPLGDADARDLAGEEVRLRPKRGPVGLVQTPWYFHPPVSPYNAGAFSRASFEQWNAANQHPVAITGWDVAKLASSRPSLFVLSDLETMDLVRLKDPAASRFTASLRKTYQGRETFGPWGNWPAWLAPPRSWAPPDWLYPYPRMTVYYSPRDATH